MQQLTEALTNSVLDIADIVIVLIVLVGGLAVWRRVRVRLPGGIEIGKEADDLSALLAILEEQRDAYNHLSGRVQTLESKVVKLERQLADARRREAELEAELSEERTQAGERIAALEAALEAAKDRIRVLEAELADALQARR